MAASPLAEEMLSGLNAHSVVGLALVPDLLRHPVGLKRPLASLADFQGARIRDIPSRATDALITALGATPLHVSNSEISTATAQGRVDGGEFSLGNASGIVTGNVTFFGKALTLFAGERVFGKLTDEQRSVLRRAAEQTLRHVIAHSPSESALARRFCANNGPIGNGRLVLARQSELAALVRAAQPVYAQLERDPQTKAFIAEIRRLKASTPPSSPLVIPKGCSRPQTAPAASGKLRSPSIVNGTYHLLFTRAAARRFGPPANQENYPTVETRILRDGKWLYGGGDRGTYTIRGNRITIVAAQYGTAEVFVFTLVDDVLRLTPVLPMDRGDQWVTAGVPWRRVGPPRAIP